MCELVAAGLTINGCAGLFVACLPDLADDSVDDEDEAEGRRGDPDAAGELLGPDPAATPDAEVFLEGEMAGELELELGFPLGGMVNGILAN